MLAGHSCVLTLSNVCQVFSVSECNFVRTNALDNVAVNVIVGSKEKVVDLRTTRNAYTCQFQFVAKKLLRHSSTRLLFSDTC